MEFVDSAEIYDALMSVTRAFKDAPVLPAGKISAFATHPDSAELCRVFAGRSWKDVGLDELLSQRDNVVLLTPDAFRAYLPAFLVACLVVPRRRLDVFWDNIVSNLSGPAEAGADLSRWSERIGTLGDAQRATLVRCLSLMRKEELADWGGKFPDGADRIGVAIARCG